LETGDENGERSFALCDMLKSAIWGWLPGKAGMEKIAYLSLNPRVKDFFNIVMQPSF
jgi:hypothetical protein